MKDFSIHHSQLFFIFQKLYHLGARRIGITGLPPVGCLPSQRSLAGGIERECVPLYNQAAKTLNSELQMEIQRLNRTLAGSTIVYIDMYTPLLDMILRPSAYGNVVDLTFMASSQPLHRTAKIIHVVNVYVHFIFLTSSCSLCRL